MLERDIDYVLISHTDKKQLANYVKEKLKKNYKCVGGVFVVDSPMGTKFYQSMVLQNNYKNNYRRSDNFGNY